jgi:hypothetical protein
VPGYGMPLQLWVQAARLGLRIREVPVSLIYWADRQFGGTLDNPAARLLYYYEVLIHALSEQAALSVGEGSPSMTQQSVTTGAPANAIWSDSRRSHVSTHVEIRAS